MSKAYKWIPMDAWAAWRSYARTGGIYGNLYMEPGALSTHLCLRHQLPTVYRNKYSGHSDLMLMCVDLEKARGVFWRQTPLGEMYPHVREPLRLDTDVDYVIPMRGLSPNIKWFIL